MPFGTLFALCFLWFGISVPLVFIGSYFGYKKPASEVGNQSQFRPINKMTIRCGARPWSWAEALPANP